jgi:hypothetical protein
MWFTVAPVRADCKGTPAWLRAAGRFNRSDHCLQTRSLRCGPSFFRYPAAGLTGRFAATRSGRWMSVWGRLRPVVGVPAMAGPEPGADLRHQAAAVKRLAVFRSRPLRGGVRQHRGWRWCHWRKGYSSPSSEHHDRASSQRAPGSDLNRRASIFGSRQQPGRLKVRDCAQGGDVPCEFFSRADR